MFVLIVSFLIIGLSVLLAILIQRRDSSFNFSVEIIMEYLCPKDEINTISNKVIECIGKAKESRDDACYKREEIMKDIMLECDSIMNEKYCNRIYVPYVTQPMLGNKIRESGFLRTIPCSEAFLDEQKKACKEFEKKGD